MKCRSFLKYIPPILGAAGLPAFITQPWFIPGNEVKEAAPKPVRNKRV